MRTFTSINPKFYLGTNNHLALFNEMHPFHKRGSMFTHSYLAAWHYPVGNSQEGQAYGDPQYRPALHSD